MTVITSLINATYILQYVNQLRSLHHASPVVYNTTLNLYAQNWSNTMASHDVLYHSSGIYGENIAEVYVGTKPNATAGVLAAIKMWYSEANLYNYSANTFNPYTGHFSQLVWLNTRQIGLGIAYNKTYGFVTMEFYPPGNVLNAFTQNVLKT